MPPRSLMDADFPKERTAFVFSDPAGRRWPRLRLTLLFGGFVSFLAAIFFVQTLFVTPQLRLPFTLHQLKGQLKSMQKKNPAGQLLPNLPLWEKFVAARAAARKYPAFPDAGAGLDPKISRRRSAAWFLHQRRSVQLSIARASRCATDARLSRMVRTCRWSRQHADRR